MTTTIAKRQEPQTSIATRVDVLEGVTFADLVSMGDQLAKTGFLPEYVRTGSQFAALVMTGRELGMSPMRAIRSLQMVKGKVVEDAASQLARFKLAGGRASFLSLDETQAVLKVTHPNGDEHTETGTVDDARKAGLSGGMMAKFPKAMLRSRCITAALKSVGWDGAVGTYDVGELVDTDETQTPAPTPIVRQVKAPVVLEAEVVVQALDLEPAYKLAEMVVDLDLIDDQMRAWFAGEVAKVTDESKAGRAVAFALDALFAQRSCQLAGEDWVAEPAAQRSVAKLREKVGQRSSVEASIG